MARQYDEILEDERFKQEVEQLIANYIAPGAEFDPFKPDHVSEALGEWETYPVHEAYIAAYLKNGSYAEVGEYINAVTVRYWTNLAAKQAEIDAQEHFDRLAEQAEQDAAEYRYQCREDDVIDAVWY